MMLQRLAVSISKNLRSYLVNLASFLHSRGSRSPYLTPHQAREGARVGSVRTPSPSSLALFFHFPRWFAILLSLCFVMITIGLVFMVSPVVNSICLFRRVRSAVGNRGSARRGSRFRLQPFSAAGFRIAAFPGNRAIAAISALLLDYAEARDGERSQLDVLKRDFRRAAVDPFPTIRDDEFNVGRVALGCTLRIENSAVA